jgi:hypothetical protein
MRSHFKPSRRVLAVFSLVRYARDMSEPPERLTPASPEDLAAAIAFALRYEGRKRVHNADELMSEIVARRLVEHLERSGFVVMKRPPAVGGAAIERGFEGWVEHRQ